MRRMIFVRKFVFVFWMLLLLPFFWKENQAGIRAVPFDKKIIRVDSYSNSSLSDERIESESWMGIYMNGIKVGYTHSQETILTQDSKECTKNRIESRMKISRLGGNPVEIVSIQEDLYDENQRPLESLLKTKMSESETRIKAEVGQDKIECKKGDKIIKTLPFKGQIYFGVPVKKIIEKEGLEPGNKYKFKIMNLLSLSLMETSFEIIGKEDILVLGKKMNLWHVRESATFVIPLTTEAWMDEQGNFWKTMSQTSFATLTSIRMPKEKALEVSEENFDIAFSSVIKPNIIFEKSQEVQRAKFELSGVSVNKIKNFPYDDGSQRILRVEGESVIIETCSQIFQEKDAVPLPFEDEKWREFLKPTTFCQSDERDVLKVAQKIIDGERNSWRASKRIAEWVKNEMTSNYDVGFASAKEILKNKEGDCSEYTVLTVALCRAVGIPARAAVGIMYGGGIFAYHMWPEVYVGQWINLDSKWMVVDKKTGEYYTDATHIKFGRTSLDENIFKEMVQSIAEIVGKLELKVLDYNQDK